MILLCLEREIWKLFLNDVITANDVTHEIDNKNINALNEKA